ncbi:MAG: HAD-IIIC family phosphatase [Bryobacteraceae bacterium]|nr:HAD-IIIC family phosphatase [Bryobacteraceae bacterium]
MNPRMTIDKLLQDATSSETPPGELCLALARAYRAAGDWSSALRWATATLAATDQYALLHAAAATVPRQPPEGLSTLRVIRLAVLGSYTTTQMTPLLRLAALARGIWLDVYESPYGQFQQELLDENSGTAQFRPDVILLAVHERDVQLPPYSATPDDDLTSEVSRWTSLWSAATQRLRATVIQPTFVTATADPAGHLGSRPGFRTNMLRRLNLELARHAGPEVLLLDAERLAGQVGHARWFNSRYWHLSRQGISLDCLPLFVRHAAALVAAAAGLTKKCLVVDLDNTLWGGVIGDDGLDGLRLGPTPEGEPYVELQDFLLGLKQRGVLLAVCSKNDPATAQEVFRRHPGMRMQLSDFAVFHATWAPKPEAIREIAERLSLGLDSLVFLDDNPAERQAVSMALPQVDVIPLPEDPAAYRTALANYLGFESAAFTQDDARRTEQYQARESANALAGRGNLDEFYRSLKMRAEVSPITAATLPRAAQLINKTNQFNLTTRRRTLPELTQLMGHGNYIHLTLTLSDAFSNHGLVGVIIGRMRGTSCHIDTWLLSCRVIGRTVDATLLSELSNLAAKQGCRTLTGCYIPTQRNALVKDLYANHGFVLTAAGADGSTYWERNLETSGLVPGSPYVAVSSIEVANDADTLAQPA